MIKHKHGVRYMWNKNMNKPSNNVICMQTFKKKKVKNLNDQPKPAEVTKYGFTWSFPDHEPA